MTVAFAERIVTYDCMTSLSYPAAAVDQTDRHVTRGFQGDFKVWPAFSTIRKKSNKDEKPLGPTYQSQNP